MNKKICISSDFNFKKLKIFESFAGIGAQKKAISNIKKLENKFEITKISDWDARAIISYALIHHNKKFYKCFNKLSSWKDSEINKYLNDRDFSLNSKDISRITRKDMNFKKTLIAANIVTNNLSNIQNVRGVDIQNIDLLTYSFPCQGLSVANMGQHKGLRNNKSTSKFVWEIERILIEAKNNNISLPKYLLMENVKNLVSKKHLKDFQEWLNHLEGLGYRNFWTILDSSEYGWIQKRQRLLCISIEKKFFEKKLKKFDESNFKEWFHKKYSNSLSKENRKKIYFDIFSKSIKHIDEIISATPRDTPSRKRMAETSIDLISEAENKDYFVNTLTTKQDRDPNIGMIPLNSKVDGYLNKRFITTREAYLLMGFENKDFDLIKPFYQNNVLTKESLYRQAGNSIVVNILEKVFQFIDDFEKFEEN